MERLVSGHNPLQVGTKKKYIYIYWAILEKCHSYNLIVHKLSQETKKPILLSMSMKKFQWVTDIPTTLCYTHMRAHAHTHVYTQWNHIIYEDNILKLCLCGKKHMYSKWHWVILSLIGPPIKQLRWFRACVCEKNMAWRDPQQSEGLILRPPELRAMGTSSGVHFPSHAHPGTHSLSITVGEPLSLSPLSLSLSLSFSLYSVRVLQRKWTSKIYLKITGANSLGRLTYPKIGSPQTGDPGQLMV